MSWITLVLILCVLAIVAAWKFPRLAMVHFALIIGSIIFAFPLIWQVLTSLKEENDLALSPGLITTPRVQETADYANPNDPLYKASFDNRSVLAKVIEKKGNSLLLEVMRPAGLRGQTFNAASKDVTEVPQEVPMVKGTWKGATVTGYVTKDNEDGSKEVHVTTPQGMVGKDVHLGAKDFEPLYRTGFRWANYRDALEEMPADTYYGTTYLRNTLILVALNLVGTLISSAMIAYGFARIQFPGRETMFKVLLSALMLPGAVTMLPQFLIYRQLGWIDTLAPLWVASFFGSAFNVFLLRQFFLNLPKELEDAAIIDGCGHLRIFWRIMVPQIKPALAAISVWTFIATWNDFMGPLVYINSPELMTLSYGLQQFMTGRTQEPAMLMAASTMTILPVIAVFAFAQKYFIEGMSLTGLGGR